MYHTIIKNNFFHNPDDIVENSKSIEWIKSTAQDNWPGYRSKNLYDINNFFIDI